MSKCLVNKYQVPKTDIVILSPYREQRSRISDRLKGAYGDILVTTVVKSQGKLKNNQGIQQNVCFGVSPCKLPQVLA